MAARIFLIGTTGHIGSAVLHSLLKRHPSVAITALVRSKKDADAVAEQWGDVTPIVGTLENPVLLEKEAAKASIVINCGPDVLYAAGIGAVLEGLSRRSAPSFYIGTSGVARLWDAPSGSEEGRFWDDVLDFASLPVDAPHAATDSLVLSANSSTMHTAIVAPPWVFGVSPSKTHPTPLSLPDILHVVKQLGCGFAIGEGRNKLTCVDVQVLALLYLALVEDAIRTLAASPDGKATSGAWGPDAYYFAPSVVEISFAEFMRNAVLPALRKHGAPFLRSTDVKPLSVDEATSIVMARYGEEGEHVWSRVIASSFGTSTRTTGSRSAKVLGLSQDIADAVSLVDEAVRMMLFN